MEAGQVPHRAGEPAAEDRHHADHGADRRPTGQDQVAAEKKQERRTERLERADEHPEPALNHRLLNLQLTKLLVQAVEAQLLDAFLGEGLHQQDARDAQHLLHVGGSLRQLLLDPLAGAVVRTAQVPAGHQHQRHQGQGRHRQLPAEADHKGQGAERDHQAAHESEDRVRDDIVDATDVVVHPREQVSRAAAGEEPDRLLHQAPEELPAEVEHDALADVVGMEALQDAHETGGERRGHTCADDEGQLRETTARVCEEVDQRLGHQCGHQAETGARADAGEHQQRPGPVRKEVAEHATEQPAGEDRLLLTPVGGHARAHAVALWHST